MQSSIIEKLRRELGEAISTERQVVYVLVEIRKLLELTERQDEFDALWFHASWAVHPKLSRGVALNILELFDASYSLLQERELAQLPADLRRKIDDVIAMKLLRSQLKEFLTEYGLDLSFVEQQWTTFVRLYALVIEDCPLVVAAPHGGLQRVSHLVVNLDDAREKLRHGNKEFLLYRVRWTCHRKDGESGEISSYFTIP